MSEADFRGVPEHDGVRVVNVQPGGDGAGAAGWWLGSAAVVLAVLAGAAAVVSWDAQFTMVAAVKHTTVVAALEAGIPDAGAVIFAALGVALALHGRRAVRPRALNATCIGISLAMNALAAGHGWRDLAIWVMPAAVYAVASDTLIGVVRAWVLARARGDGETLADDGPTPLAMAGNLALWLLRLALAPPSTLAGFRDWVIRDCPVAPGLRPGHVAELAAFQQDAERRLALAAGERDEAVVAAVRQAQQAREEAARAEAAEGAMRGELDRARTDADRIATGLRADADRVAAGLRAEAAREGEAARAWAERQVAGLRTELQQAREEAGHALAQVREASAARVAAVEEARAELRAHADQAREEAAVLRAERDRLAAQLRAAAAQPPQMAAAVLARQGRGGPTKRDQLIMLAGQRQDLASLPLGEVSKLASGLAAEIGYSAGTARRELLRHVRGLQAAPGNGSLIPEEV